MIAAEVYLWGTRIGYVAQESVSDIAKFNYDLNFIRSGIEVSPITMPLSERIYSFQGLQYMKDDVDTEYLYCNEAYGQMVLNSEKVKENMPKLIDALQYLAKDYSDANGYHRMQSFNNSVMYEEE